MVPAGTVRHRGLTSHVARRPAAQPGSARGRGQNCAVHARQCIAMYLRQPIYVQVKVVKQLGDYVCEVRAVL